MVGDSRWTQVVVVVIVGWTEDEQPYVGQRKVNRRKQLRESANGGNVARDDLLVLVCDGIDSAFILQ